MLVIRLGALYNKNAMSEYVPNQPPSFREGEQPFFDGAISDDSLNRLIEHEKGLKQLMDVLVTAQELDKTLVIEGQRRNNRLTRRFVIDSDGDDPNYVFSHERVSLSLNNNFSENHLEGIEGVVLRFATKPEETDLTQYNNRILVTLGLQDGITAEYLFSPTEWTEVNSHEDLIFPVAPDGSTVAGSELLGARGSDTQGNLELNDFLELVRAFEPELQSKRD